MSYLIDQEAWLAYYAERLGVSRNNLGERDIRLGLALYHGAYLPTAAVIELRHNELDLETRYAEFGYTPNTPSFASAKVRVQLSAAPATTLTLGAPFVVTQADKRFVATEPLIIQAGQTIGTANVQAELQGADGTPQEAAANITISVGWLRGAAISLTDVTPGRDGEDIEAIAADFRAYAFNPQALVRAEDHAAWVEHNNADIGRAFHAARTSVLFDGSTYTPTYNIAGHLTLALVSNAGGLPAGGRTDEIKQDLLGVTVPYGEDALHVVPAVPVNVTGSIQATIEAGRDHEAQKEDILSALEDYLDWRTWRSGHDVYAGDIWGVVSDVPGVRFVTAVTLAGGDLAIAPYQYPVSAFLATDITLTE